MGTRLELQSLLEDVLGSDKVYFQPPESIKMSYPAFVYYLYDVDIMRANDSLFHKWNHYRIQYISRDPDNNMISKLLTLQYCSYFGRSNIDNLYHDNFDLYY